jgi:hypothetical protein
VLIEGGELKCWEPSDGRQYQFVRGDGVSVGKPGSLSDGVTLRIEGAPASIVIEIESRHGVRLVTLVADSDGIEAAFSNLPTRTEVDRYLDTTPPLVKLNHFLAYYDLLVEPPSGDDRSFPIEVKRANPIFESPRCKPGVRLQVDIPPLRVWGGATASHHH